ncbi:ABC transporter substrate-binding protein [Solicola gregarius]|uniref:ABC transporter substrate-binding protein n=1 Tax=Solicola gregarius TaxID=2908642 RepID=A0AA46TIN9_9ACTN|nr:ABC transporter substrate-binding protein [Solicola gregarius]UYM05965.1 ABC transporter substrate-binding protein [Solicola gregarius]
MNRRIILPATLLSAAALALTGCAGSDSGGGKPPSDDELVATTKPASGPADSVNWMLSAEPATLDADVGASDVEDSVIANMCERLFQVQPDYSVKPHLAKSVTRPNPTTVVYALRDDVTFHDGSPLAADDVVWSMQRHAEPGADESDEYEGVKNVEKTGEYEVTVTLEQPDAQFDMRMAGDGGIVWNRAVIDRAGDSFGTPDSPDACSGPYQLKEWKAGTSITLEAAPNYWDKDRAVNTQSLTYTWGAAPAVVNAVNAGETDGTFLTDPSLVGPLESNDELSVSYGATTTSWQVFPSRGDGALGDARIRTALSLAMDRDGIVKAAFDGRAEPWKLPVGSGTWGYAPDAFQDAFDKVPDTPSSPSDADIDKAKDLVEQVGDPGPITLATSGSEIQNVMANGVRTAAAEIGLEVEIKTLSDAQYSELYGSEDARAKVDGMIGDWYLSKPDPLGMYDNAMPGGVNNYVGFDDPKYAQAFNAAAGEYDETKRANLTVKVQDIYLDNMLSIPLVMTPNTLVTSDKLSGAPVSMAYLTYPWAADLGSA